MTETSPGRRATGLIVVTIGQLVSWGSVGFLSVAVPSVASDLGLSAALAFAGNTVFYVIMALFAPLLGNTFIRLGAKQVMIAGASVMAAGFFILSQASGLAHYMAAWMVLGMGGAACLTTAAHILLNEAHGNRAAGAISALMLMTGLSSTIFLPAGAGLIAAMGWRFTLLIYGASMIVVAALYALVLPLRPTAGHGSPKRPDQDEAPMDRTFLLIAASVALNGFVTFGLSAVLVELLKSLGASLPTAVATASILGLVQVGARGVDILSRGMWSGLTSGVVATTLMLLAMAMLAAFGISGFGLAAFVAFYGIGSGIFAVARATIPLTFYDRAAFVRASSRIALPLNLMSAGAAPVLAWLLTHWGATGIVALAAIVLTATLITLVILLGEIRAGQS